MFRFVLILLLVSCCCKSKSQSTTGLTGVPDTSYSLYSEYKKLQKNYPQIKVVQDLQPNLVISKKNITYCKVGNRGLKLDVFTSKSKTKSRKTAILIIHGGGWRSGNRTLHYPLAQRLASLGYVCFTPEYRLSTESLYPAAVHDIKSAIQWVRKNAKLFNIDTARIVIAGHSAGGELAAFMGATNGNSFFDKNNCNSKHSSKVNAVIDMDGTLAFIHPESGEGDDSKKISAATQWFGYSKTENPELWKQAAPLTHVGQNTAPILFINSSVARMHAGREDFIRVLNQYNIYSEVKTFEGSPHSFILFNPWFDSAIITIDRFCQKVFPQQLRFPLTELTVSQEGTGIFGTVQAALDAIPYNNTQPIRIYIKEGIYKEKIFLDSTKNFITLSGNDNLNTILTYDDHTGKVSPSGDTINTRTSWSFKIKGDNFKAENITFQNDAGYSAGQAVAVESDGDKAVFVNCRFIGNQDVLFTNSDNSRQYYQNCYIEGTTDFIFGSSTVWFEKCHIHSKKNSHITAASTPKEKEFGYIFNNCKITGDTSLHNVSLGRPWRPYAQVLYKNCYIGEHIKPEGWSNWNNTENYKTARYAEYKNYGPSAGFSGRLNWIKQLSDEEANKITLSNVLGGWNPDR